MCRDACLQEHALALSLGFVLGCFPLSSYSQPALWGCLQIFCSSCHLSVPGLCGPTRPIEVRGTHHLIQGSANTNAQLLNEWMGEKFLSEATAHFLHLQNSKIAFRYIYLYQLLSLQSLSWAQLYFPWENGNKVHHVKRILLLTSSPASQPD